MKAAPLLWNLFLDECLQFGRVVARTDRELTEEIMQRRLTNTEHLIVSKFMSKFLAYADD